MSQSVPDRLRRPGRLSRRWARALRKWFEVKSVRCLAGRHECVRVWTRTVSRTRCACTASTIGTRIVVGAGSEAMCTCLRPRAPAQATPWVGFNVHRVLRSARPRMVLARECSIACHRPDGQPVASAWARTAGVSPRVMVPDHIRYSAIECFCRWVCAPNCLAEGSPHAGGRRRADAR